jgi:hypothetical protein
MTDKGHTADHADIVEETHLGFWRRKTAARNAQRTEAAEDDDSWVKHFTRGHAKSRYWLNVSAGISAGIVVILAVSGLTLLAGSTNDPGPATQPAPQPPQSVEETQLLTEQSPELLSETVDPTVTPDISRLESHPPMDPPHAKDVAPEAKSPPIAVTLEVQEQPRFPPIPIWGERVRADGQWHGRVTNNCACLTGRHTGTSFLSIMLFPTSSEEDDNDAPPLVFFQVQEPELIAHTGLVSTISIRFDFPDGTRTIVPGAGWIANGVLNVHAGDSSGAVHGFQFADSVSFAFDESPARMRVHQLVYIDPFPLNQSLTSLRGLRQNCPLLAHYPERPPTIAAVETKIEAS